MEVNQVYFKRNMLSGNFQQHVIEHGESILDIVCRILPNKYLHKYLHVSLNYEKIDRETWENVFPTENDIVILSLVPQGSGDRGKTGLAVISMIALAFVSYGALPAIGLTGTALSVGQSVVMLGGALAVNALFAPPPLKSNPAVTTSDSAAFLGISNQKNQARLYQPVRSIYGTYRIAPDLAAVPYIMTAGDIQTFYAVFDFGYGQVNISDIRIGNTPLSYYKGAIHRIRKNYTSGNLSIYKNDHKLEAMETEIKTSKIHRITPAADTDEVSLEIAFPQGLGGYFGILPDYATDYLFMAGVTFQVQLRKTDGSTGVIDYGESDQVTFSHQVIEGTLTTVQAADKFRFNNLFDTYDPAYPGIQSDRGWTKRKAGSAFEVQVDGVPYHKNAFTKPGAKTLSAGQKFNYLDQTHTILTANKISSTEVSLNNDNFLKRDKYNITISPAIPAGKKTLDVWTVLWTWQSTGFEQYGWKHKYSGGRQSGQLTRPVSNTFTLNRAHNQPFVFSMNMKLPSPGEWEIIIKRTSLPRYDEEGQNRYLDKTVLVAVKSITYRKPLEFKRPHTILELKLTATDQLSGSLETVTALCSRVLDTWNGTAWIKKETSNPAWIAIDIMTGVANPRPIDKNRIDLDQFLSWANFCDTIHPDHGDAYYQYDANQDGSGTVFERLLEVMAAGRAAFTYRDNKISVIYENFPTVPKQLITAKNSWNFQARKSFIKVPDAVNVSYIDPEQEWQMVDIPVYNDGFGPGQKTPEYIEDISLPNVTRTTQAWRDGRYFIAQIKLRPEDFTVQLDIENLIAHRGQLIKLQHDVGFIGGTPLTVVDIPAPDTIKTDQPVMYDPTKTYKLRVRYQNGTQDELTVQSVSSTDATEITLTAAAPNLNVKDLVVYGEDTFVTDEFLIKSVSPGEDLTAELALIPIARDIQTADQGTIPAYDPNISDENMLYPDEVNPVTIEQELLYEDRFPKFNVILQWQDKGNRVIYEIWQSDDGGENYYLHDTTPIAGNYLLWNKRDTLASDYPADLSVYVKIRAVNEFGFKLPLEQCTPVVFIALTDKTPPGKPLFFSGNINSDTMELTWLPPDDPDLSGYILKYSSDHDNADWFRATIETGLIPYDKYTINVNARLGSYLLKTIDTSGNESKDFALIRTTIPALEGLNVIETINEHDAPVFDGNKTHTEFVSGGIRLEKEGGNATYKQWGTYTSKKVFDVGAIHECRCIASAKAYGAEDIFISSWTVLAEVDPLAATKEGAWNVALQIRTATRSDVIADWASLDVIDPIGGIGSNWSGWQMVTAGNFTGKYFQFRIVLTSVDQKVSPHVYEAAFQIDMPDRIISGHDITCPLGGMRVTFPGAFKNVPAVAITQEVINDASDYYVLDNITSDGFDLEFFEAGHVSMQAQFDYIAKGYGKILTSMLTALDPGDEDKIELLPGAMAHLTRRDILT